MNRYYQVVNFQHQSVRTFKFRTDAEKLVSELRTQFPDEGFYIIELNVVYSSGDIQ